MQESYRLDQNDGRKLVELWTLLQNDRVTRSKPLSTAIRRFDLAGERLRPEDQIIDLMIAAEAIFLPGESTESAHKLSLRAALLLDSIGDARPAREIALIMKRAYDARSKLAHGSEAPDLKLPDGSPATLDDYVEIVAAYMRKSLRWLIACAAAGEASPISDRDACTFSRL